MDPANEFEELYREAYHVIDNGIILITERKTEEAKSVLKYGLSLIDKALCIKVEAFDVSHEKIQLYEEMKNKMRVTRKEVLHHLMENETTSDSTIHSDDNPPSYDEYLTSLQSEGVDGINSVSYPSLDPRTLNLDPMNLSGFDVISPLATPTLSPQNGTRIFHIENGVQIFFIYSDGRVTSPSYPSFLSIFTFQDPICYSEESGCPGARGFLQVGEWNYPLIPAQSPVLHSFYGAYMFPDVSNQVPGTNVGILIPDSVPKDMIELFEEMLTQLTSYQEQIAPKGVDVEAERLKVARKSNSEMIAEGAESISKGVVWGTEKLSEWISYGSDRLKDSIAPETQQRPVDPKWQKTAKVARNVSGKAVKISGFLLNQVGKATMALGKWAAPTIQKGGTKVVGRLTGSSEKEAHSQVSSVMEVAAGAMKGFSTVYMSLENAAANLAVALSDNTVKIVSHKYGDNYGQLTGDTLYAVGQSAMVGHNISSLGVKGIAKKTAKDAGKAVLSSYERERPGSEHSTYQSDEPEDVMQGIEEAKEVKELPEKK